MSLDEALGILNGAIGDYLARTKNGLAIEMAFVDRGRPLRLERQPLARALPNATARVVVLVHGLMCTESVWRLPDGTDYGARLAADLGFTPLYVRYNSGRSIADSGASLARMLDALVDAYPCPIETLLPIGYSMGGLVVRSACHVARAEKHGWLDRVGRAIYVGTPHLGAPLERIGRVVTSVLAAIDDPYTRLIAQIADLRSDGVKDLGDADLRHEDRARRIARLTLRDPRHPVPLLPEIRHYLAAGSLSDDPALAMLFGDALVPVPSATDGACASAATIGLPPSHVRVFPGMTHLAIAHHADVYAQIRAWCEATE